MACAPRMGRIVRCEHRMDRTWWQYRRMLLAVQLVTFGGLHAFDGGRELEPLLTQRSRAALLICLTIERRVARDALTAMFWPESDAESARHALRQSLYHLSKVLGGRHWIDPRAYELVVCSEVAA